MRSPIVVPPNAIVEVLRCSSCGRIASVIALPQIPPAPVEVRSLFRAIMKILLRTAGGGDGLRRMGEHMIQGELREAIAALRSSDALAGAAPLLCRDCVIEHAAAAFGLERLEPGD